MLRRPFFRNKKKESFLGNVICLNGSWLHLLVTTYTLHKKYIFIAQMRVVYLGTYQMEVF
nr:hypothetical protein Q903MT_gene6101 [Picea sitchensis]